MLAPRRVPHHGRRQPRRAQDDGRAHVPVQDAKHSVRHRRHEDRHDEGQDERPRGDAPLDHDAPEEAADAPHPDQDQEQQRHRPLRAEHPLGGGGADLHGLECDDGRHRRLALLPQPAAEAHRPPRHGRGRGAPRRLLDGAGRRHRAGGAPDERRDQRRRQALVWPQPEQVRPDHGAFDPLQARARAEGLWQLVHLPRRQGHPQAECAQGQRARLRQDAAIAMHAADCGRAGAEDAQHHNTDRLPARPAQPECPHVRLHRGYLQQGERAPLGE
mmetsp:Transcript_33539/g.91854  ORF Transcript_33539/g.91854 Transcript_33539/m.91854 type:complete len:273 (+) Transcript_33539:547-1365(+)